MNSHEDVWQFPGGSSAARWTRDFGGAFRAWVKLLEQRGFCFIDFTKVILRKLFTQICCFCAGVVDIEQDYDCDVARERFVYSFCHCKLDVHDDFIFILILTYISTAADRLLRFFVRDLEATASLTAPNCTMQVLQKKKIRVLLFCVCVCVCVCVWVCVILITFFLRYFRKSSRCPLWTRRSGVIFLSILNCAR